MTELTRREMEGAAAPGETCQQRNMRMGWGCKCHGETFCPDLVFSHYEDDQPVFKQREESLKAPEDPIEVAIIALRKVQ